MPLVFLIRHTRVRAPRGLCYGRMEVPLAPSFDEEAAAVWAQLPCAPEQIWSSPAARCRQLAERLGNNVRLDERLLELDFGAWEGRTWESFHGPGSEAWARDPWSVAPPGGERGEQLWRRVQAFRQELVQRGGGPLAVVTHAGVIRAWRAQAEGRPWSELLLETVEFGGVYSEAG